MLTHPLSVGTTRIERESALGDVVGQLFGALEVVFHPVGLAHQM